jgi:predicted porin
LSFAGNDASRTMNMFPQGTDHFPEASLSGECPQWISRRSVLFTKKMITLMVLATMLVAGAALAGDNYTVYGKLHTSIDYMSDTEDSQIMMANNTSRFGFKGSKELNENCTMIWQFESAINLAQKGANTLVTRNSFLGLTGKVGTFLYGIHDTPFKTVGRKATFFYDELGDHRQSTMGWDRRLQDVVVYASPDFSGFSFVGGYMLDQGVVGADEALTSMSFSGSYKMEGLYVGAAYEALSTGFSDNGDGTFGETQSGMRFSAKYDLGTFALAGLFQALSNVGGVEDASATTMGFEGKFTMNETYSAKAAFYLADPNTDADDDEYNLLAIGVDRNLGQKTYMYLQYAMTMNGDAQMMGIGGPGHGSTIGASAAGESPMGVSWGLVTKF